MTISSSSAPFFVPNPSCSPSPSLFASGSNSSGQLGIASKQDSHQFVPCTFLNNVPLCASTEPTKIGDGFSDQIEGYRYESVLSIIKLSSGGSHTVALVEENKNWEGKPSKAGLGAACGNEEHNLDSKVSSMKGRRRFLYISGTTATGPNPFPQIPEQDPKQEQELHSFHRVTIQDLISSLPTTSTSGSDLSPKGLLQQTQNPELEYYINDVACGWDATFVVLRHQSQPQAQCPENSDILISFGGNDFSQRGTGVGSGVGSDSGRGWVVDFNLSDTFRIEMIEAGLRHVVVLISTFGKEGEGIGRVNSTSSGLRRRKEKRLFGWGAARHGQIGEKMESQNFIAGGKLPRSMDVPSWINLPLDWGASASLGLGSGRGSTHLEPSEIIAISAGKDHTALLVQSPDRIVVMGSNKHSQLGGGSGYNLPPEGNEQSLGKGERCGIVKLKDLDRDFENNDEDCDNTSSLRRRIKSISCTWNGVVVLVERDNDGRQMKTMDDDAEGSVCYQVYGWGSVFPGTKWVQPQKIVTIDDAARETCKLVAGSEHVLIYYKRRGSGKGKVLGFGWNEHGNLGIQPVDDEEHDDKECVEQPVELNIDKSGARDWDMMNVWAGQATSFILCSKTYI